MKATWNGSLQGENDFRLLLAIVQICLVFALTRTLAFLLRPLRQPYFIAEIIGGILLGPSALGRSKVFMDTIFPEQSMTLLDLFANLGLLFFLFLVGLELDLNSLRRTCKCVLAINVAGISLPFVLGIGTSVVLRKTIAEGIRGIPLLIFMGVALSITAFPVLSCILVELKLLTTDVGRMTMSAAAVNNVATWILLALAITLSSSGSPLVPLWMLLSSVAFVALATLVLRPVLVRMARSSPEGEPIKKVYINAILATVLAASFITDTIGIHALFGAFVVGIVVPKEGPFTAVLIEKAEEFSGAFLPFYFISSGLKTNITTISDSISWALLALVIFNACLGKIGGTVLASLVMKVPLREALTLGFLMNTKGLVELIVLNIGKDLKVLNDETFTIMVLMALFTTFMTMPIVMWIYNAARQAAPYEHRKIERADTDSELRILACFHCNCNHIEDQRCNDNECFARLRERVAANSDGSIKLEEKVVGKEEEIVLAIKGVGRCKHFLVGQRAPVMPLRAQIDFPELGPVGSYMGASNSTAASVLVMRQHDPSIMTTSLVEVVVEDAVLSDTLPASGSYRGEFNPF